MAASNAMVTFPDSSNFVIVDIPSPVARQHEENQCFATLRPLIPFVYVLPRSKNKLFEEISSTNLVMQDLLPDFLSAGDAFLPWRAIEGRFYVDIAQSIGGGWKAERKITALCLDVNRQPVEGRAITWRRGAGSKELKFVANDGTELDELGPFQCPVTDENGMAEIKIRHPARRVEPADERVQIEATIEGETAWVGLVLTRNDSATSIDAIGRQADTCADALWVYQPDDAHRSPLNNGIKDLQEDLNEVVSRHKTINSFSFIELDGVYGDNMRDGVDKFRQNFPAIKRGADYPYDLTGLNLSSKLREYLRSEYTFDADKAANRGWIVDRRLLIGDKWDLAANALDGLLELKQAVVDRLKTEMVRMANSYLNESTFWLHRPVHSPYTAGAAHVFRVTQAGVVSVKANASATASDLLDAAGHPITVSSGELYPSPSVHGGWTQITLDAGPGWVHSNAGKRMTDDQSVAEDAGTLGGNGVAYSFGCKCRPDEYVADLTSNPHAPAQNGPGRQLRVANWEEYADQHKPGRRETDGATPDVPHCTGCDCSGFTQNCITEAMLEGTSTRVVPNTVMARLRRVPSRWTQNEIAADGFVGLTDYARPVPRPTTDTKTNWMRRGDILSTATHVVWVADEMPAIVVAAASNGQTFEIYNEFGGDRYYLANGTQAPVDHSKFVRKSIRMPFHWWGAHFNNVNIGKVYVWH